MLCIIVARTIRPEAEERGETCNLHRVRWKGCLFANWLWRKCLVSDTSFPLQPRGKKRTCTIIVSRLVTVMVDSVRNLRKSGVQAVIISCGSRGSSVVGKEFLACWSFFNNSWTEHAVEKKITSIDFSDQVKILGNQLIDRSPYRSAFRKGPCPFPPTFWKVSVCPTQPLVLHASLPYCTLGILNANITHCIILLDYVNESQMNTHVV